MGEKSPMYGKHMSEESKLKITLTKFGKTNSEAENGILIGPIFKKASKSGLGAHIMVPKSWIGKMIKCIPVDQDIEK